ncbi:MAG TPA: SRPBCC domain-containing protein [Puia sp.]
MQNESFVIERVYEAPVARVWKAISDKDEMRQWYFNVSDFQAEPGFEFQFEGHNEGRTYVHLCKVTEVVAGRKLRYSWSYKGYEGLSFVTFELFAEGNKTRLKLTHEGLETFPAIADFKKENFATGWTALIGEFLPNYLQGKNVSINP